MNKTITEWSADISMKDMQALEAFIAKQRIVLIEPVDAITPLHALLEALRFQIALEQGAA